ncbi:MAG: CoA protein activase [Firmicutes bacterium]|nr:CoA protein activase [Bacillota bacterium]
MRLTFPHMGLLSIPVETLINGLGHEAVVAPPTNKRTFELGAQFSPEAACLPFKVNLGNFIEALEQGAEGILAAGGTGPCRFGYYAQIQQQILHDLGYKFQLLLLDPPKGRTRELYRALKILLKYRRPDQVVRLVNLAWRKAQWLDRGNKLFRYFLPRSKDQGAAGRCYEEFLAKVRREPLSGQLPLHYRDLSTKLETLATGSSAETILRVKIIGEIYMVLEPRVNFHLETVLGRMGVEVVRPLSISQWVEEHLLGVFFPGHKQRTILLSEPFLPSFVGGHGRETIAELVDAGVNRLDGVIQVLPFTCMPEIVAQSITPEVSKVYGIPVLTLVIDEHSGEVGMMTRLEAFVDLMRRKKAMMREVSN